MLSGYTDEDIFEEESSQELEEKEEKEGEKDEQIDEE